MTDEEWPEEIDAEQQVDVVSVDLSWGDPDNLTGKHILDDNGEPQPEPRLDVWGDWMESHNRQIEWTEIAGGIIVSTIFLGLDHSFGNGPPLLFETRVFGGSMDGDMRRYITRKEAERGHLDMVGMVRAAEAQP